MIRAVLLILLLGGCIPAYSVKDQASAEPTETSSVTLPCKQDSGRASADIYRKDLFDRVVEFGGAIKEEVAAGQLKLRLSPLPEEVEHLSATYMPSIEAGSAEITIQCQPEYKDCFTDAFEHEAGHHIYKSLTEEQRIKIDTAVTRRLNESDAQAFQEEIAQIELRYMKLSEILRKIIKPVAECGVLRQDLAFGEGVQKELGESGISFSPEQVEQLRRKAEQYADYMPSCTPENLGQAKSSFSQVEQALTTLVTQIGLIYHQKISLGKEQLPDFAAAFPLEPVSSEKLREFYNAGQEYVNALESIVNEEVSKEEFIEESTVGQVWVGAMLSIAIYNASRSSPLTDSILYEFKLILGGHDSRAEEQFAAVVDSLADGYIGSIVTAPMRVQSDEPLLQALEQLEYHGQRVLAPLVGKYRAILQEE